MPILLVVSILNDTAPTKNANQNGVWWKTRSKFLQWYYLGEVQIHSSQSVIYKDRKPVQNVALGNKTTNTGKIAQDSSYQMTFRIEANLPGSSWLGKGCPFHQPWQDSSEVVEQRRMYHPLPVALRC